MWWPLDILVQSRRNTKAAVRFFKKLLKGLEYIPRVIVTDKLKSYTAATKKILKSTEHRKHKGLNNRIEVARQPTRLREKQMRKFKSPPRAQIFLSTFGVIKNLFRTELYKLTSQAKRNKITKHLPCGWCGIAPLLCLKFGNRSRCVNNFDARRQLDNTSHI